MISLFRKDDPAQPTPSGEEVLKALQDSPIVQEILQATATKQEQHRRDLLKRRATLVAERDKQMPKLTAAAAAALKDAEEAGRIANEKWATYSKAHLQESTRSAWWGQQIGKIDSELAAGADRAIGDFCEQVFNYEIQLRKEWNITLDSEDKTPKVTLDYLAALASARQKAEALRLKPELDCMAELRAIWDALPPVPGATPRKPELEPWDGNPHESHDLSPRGTQCRECGCGSWDETLRYPCVGAAPRPEPHRSHDIISKVNGVCRECGLEARHPAITLPCGASTAAVA